MNYQLLKFATVGMIAAMLSSQAAAYEFGSPGTDQKPGITLGGSSAAAPPPGIYMFQQFYTYQATITGPGAIPGADVPVRLNSTSTGFLFVPGWTFLGATYDAVIVQPLSNLSIGAPINSGYSGAHNTLIIPVELSWKLGDSGFFVKTGLGILPPDGSISGPAGLGNSGHPWWTFDPSLSISYLKDGWNLTAAFYLEMNTRNTVTGYTSGNILHGEFAATKRIGKWTVGPVGYYYGQVSDDQSSAFYRNAINVNRYNVWAAGGLVGYDFGSVTVNVWALNDFYSDSSGSTPVAGRNTVTTGYNVFASMSFRLWAPEAAPNTQGLKLVHK